MPRYLRFYLLACTALAFGYLAIHAGEPLRLNVGDAWTDASMMAGHLTAFRVLALVCSGLAAWLMFDYVRRMWSDQVAIIATALTATSLVWLMFADSLDRRPFMHAACFLALWGVVRVLETGLRRHYIAVLVGTFVCLVVASNDWLFLPLGVLFTVYVKGGNRFVRANWRVLTACAVGALLAMLLRSSFATSPSSWQVALDARVSRTFGTLLRRYTVLLSPMLWITMGWAVWRAVRARSLKAAIGDGTSWMLVAALLFAVLPAPRAESATLRTQLLLPFYAIGSALLITWLFEGGRLRRTLAAVWCVAAPLCGFVLMLSHPREVLDRDDLARANEYLAQNDRNSFVMSNLLANGPIVAGFGRHGWPALDDPDPSGARARMLELFETTGTAYVHAVIFTTPGSRFVERSITQVIGNRTASVDGWPYLVRPKVNYYIEAYDARVRRSLYAVGAKRVLQLGNFDVYRIDRATTLETAAQSLPVVARLDFARLPAAQHQLLGWGDPVIPGESHNASVAGHGRCRNPIVSSTTPVPNGCAVVEGRRGLDILDVGGASGAELMVRVDQVCDQRLTFTLAAPARVDIAFNDAIVLTCGDPQWGTALVSVRVSQHDVRHGLNVIRIDDVQPHPRTIRPEVKSLVIEPICEAPR